RAAAHRAFFIGDELHGLAPTRRLIAEQYRGEPLERDGPGAIEHGRRQVLIAETDDPASQLATERWHGPEGHSATRGLAHAARGFGLGQDRRGRPGVKGLGP